MGDDGSQPLAREAISRYEANGRGVSVRYIYQESGGLPVARNRGFPTARGRFVAFLDEDDLWTSEKLAKQVAVMERDAPQVGGNDDAAATRTGEEGCRGDPGDSSAVAEGVRIPESHGQLLFAEVVGHCQAVGIGSGGVVRSIACGVRRLRSVAARGEGDAVYVPYGTVGNGPASWR